MLSHKKLAEWYQQLAQLLEAGMTLAESIRQAGGPPLRDRIRLAESIEAGTSLEQAFAARHNWLPRADRVFLLTAHETGRLPQTCARLGERHRGISGNLLKLVVGLLYPLGVFHIAALILPLVPMIDYENGFHWNWMQHLLGTAALIIPLWTFIALMALMAKIESPVLPRILRCLPLLRRYSKAQAMADLSSSLGTLIEVGISAPQAWRTSATLVNDPAIRKAIRRLEPVFASGDDPAHTLDQYPCFPTLFVTLYRTGARSGSLDHSLHQAGQNFQDEANRAMTFAAFLYPSAVMALVAAIIIYSIFKIYGGYLHTFDQFM
ncbi:type II secretion system F family protein [Coraliomargarita parva]|uniref:type II secretion system F family protein n=1 Tax=Coraliomargarita parva TaxID=3014050 RepID=UPI0022B3940A|nr:type II secretion system F family protein [Coraliomargarita parva]